jgi:hypothetical protein
VSFTPEPERQKDEEHYAYLERLGKWHDREATLAQIQDDRLNGRQTNDLPFPKLTLIVANLLYVGSIIWFIVDEDWRHIFMKWIANPNPFYGLFNVILFMVIWYFLMLILARILTVALWASIIFLPFIIIMMFS